jgi:HlyD family secretion protein
MKVSGKKIAIVLVVLLVGAALVFANLRFNRASGLKVNAEALQNRDLESVVSASGKIRPKRSVNISANTMGRVTRLAVNEGDRVKSGQFLLQIDPRPRQAAVERSEAGLAAQRSSLEQARMGVETARANLNQARDSLRRQNELWAQQLTTREALERAETEVKVRESDLKARETEIATQDHRIRQMMAELNSARHDLSYVTIDSPMDGIVTRRNIEEGETVVIGTMNNPGTVLLTVADLSIIEAEVEVDETEIPMVEMGQQVKVSIDALPDRSFTGHVTEIGNSPIQVGAQAATQATNFKVIVTLDGEVPGVRPGFTCTADITTATRQQVLSVPIQAMTVREVTFDESGEVVRKSNGEGRRRRSIEPNVSASELPAGHTMKEVEGVFVVRDDKAVFVPVKTGIAGEKYFEVLSGLEAGDRVVTGPFSQVRELRDGAPVKVDQPASSARR